MHQLRPLRIEQPQRAAAARAEVTAAGADAALAVVLANAGAVYAQMLAALDLQRVGAGAEVDRKAAATGGLAADRAVAPPCIGRESLIQTLMFSDPISHISQTPFPNITTTC